MCEIFLPYILVPAHIKGSKNSIANYLSRNSGVKSCTAREFSIDTPNVRNHYVNTRHVHRVGFPCWDVL